jgi:predicted  nucleic acid-binding Zn-ribbon protein
MASEAIRRLWDLGRSDARVVAIRKRLAAMEASGKLDQGLKLLEEEEAEILGKARSLHAELRDLELRQKTIQDKIAKIERDGGKVTGPRAIELLEKEKEALRRQRDHDDERLLELFDLVPAAQKAAEEAAPKFAEAKKRLEEQTSKTVQEKAALEAEYARLTASRAAAVQGIAPAMLAKYEAVRQRSGGVGMVEVKGEVCGGCGTNLPERTLQALREDKLATCEACHRLLYFTEGVI